MCVCPTYSVSVAAPRRLLFQFGRTDSYRVATIPLNYEDNKTADGRSKVFYLKKFTCISFGSSAQQHERLGAVLHYVFFGVHMENGGG